MGEVQRGLLGGASGPMLPRPTWDQWYGLCGKNSEPGLQRFLHEVLDGHSLPAWDIVEYLFGFIVSFFLLSNLPGGSHEGYCKWACASAYAQGWRAVVLNYRGCNGVPLTAPRGYAATLTHDVARAVASIKG